MSTDLAQAAKQASGVSEQEYRALPGLSNSALKDLEISPLRYWFLHVNPNPPMVEPTPALVFGQALHCAVLEPAEFLHRYAQKLDQADLPDCLDTINEIRDWIRSKGKTPHGQLKADVIKQAQAIDPHVPILERLEAAHAAAHEGKTMLSKDFWTRVNGCVESLMSEPRVRSLLAQGQPEVSMFARDPETRDAETAGVLLKSRFDWLTPSGTIVDIKTFSQTRGNSIDKSVANAIYYERYHRQGYFYRYVQSLQKVKPEKPRFINIFVESEPPHEVRIKEQKPGNLYYELARAETLGLIRLYAECRERFGDKPWRIEQDVEPLQDEDVRQFSY